MQALPVTLLLGGAGAFMLYRLTQPQQRKVLQDQAEERMRQAKREIDSAKQRARNIEDIFSGRSRVIDIEVESSADAETPEEREIRKRRQDAEQELSDFDQRLRGRF